MHRQSLLARYLSLVVLLVWLAGSVWAQEVGPAGHVLYLDIQDHKQVLAALRTWAQKNPGIRGAALLAPPSCGWTGLAVQALETLKPQEAAELSRALSKELKVGVLHLVISEDGRAWYFYSAAGRMLDRYCSNPGLPGEVDAETLRGWAGKPDVLLPICRGRPLSVTRTQVSLTDLNALLYFYYPEMRLKKPAAYRTPAELMRLLVQVVGPPQPPAPFTVLEAAPGFKRL